MKHGAGKDPEPPDSLQLASTTELWVRVSLLKKRYINGNVSHPATAVFAYRIVIFGHYMTLNIAFHLRLIGLQTLVAIDSESCQRSFPSICELPNDEVAVLLNSSLSRRPFLRQVAFHLLPIGLQTLVVID